MMHDGLRPVGDRDGRSAWRTRFRRSPASIRRSSFSRTRSTRRRRSSTRTSRSPTADRNFNGGTLTVSNLLAQDTVAIRNQGTAAGEIGVSGSDVTFGGMIIGSFAGGAGSTLTVTFNAAATAAAIEALIENLTYANSSDTPTASRSLELKVTDAAGFAAIAPLAFAAQTGAANPFDGVDVGASPARRAFADLDGDGDLDAVVGETTAP